ncbi:DUF718 domain protein [Penicillium chermesinum]|uniref:DUF718 domain protein n=1 Tax=Penicillium chermesinum TaxID=63820 RepID=A0A9W9TXL0_9EURO|nr:DUF718 domain protein [Penicillium chermesinum]KAJ5247506.1 DUF718 domain protein [Penicillium chermesinum]
MSFVRPIAQIVHLKPSAVAAYKDIAMGRFSNHTSTQTLSFSTMIARFPQLSNISAQTSRGPWKKKKACEPKIERMVGHDRRNASAYAVSSTNESAAKENPIPGAAGSADGPGW